MAEKNACMIDAQSESGPDVAIWIIVSSLTCVLGRYFG